MPRLSRKHHHHSPRKRSIHSHHRRRRHSHRIKKKQIEGGEERAAQTNDCVQLPPWALKLASVNLYRVGVPGKGSCFFHSLYASLFPRKYIEMNASDREDRVNRYRHKLAHTLNEQSWNEFVTRRHVPERLREVDIHDMKRRMKNPEDWADERMIRFISDYLRINVIFLNDVAEGMYCGVHGEKPSHQPMIIVDWVGEQHFEPVAAKRADGKLQFLFDPSNPEDAPIVTEFMKAYTARCGGTK